MTASMAFHASLSFFILPLYNSLIAAICGDDPDEDKYADMSEWDRQNNICMRVPGTNGFLKIPNAQENRVWQRIGDNIWQAERGEKDRGDAVADMMKSMLDLIPANLVGGVAEGGWSQLLPVLLQGPVQAYTEVNRDYRGYPVYDANGEKKAGVLGAPAWTAARRNRRGKHYTPEWMIRGTEMLNVLSFGNDRKAGLVNLNPDKLYYVANSYFGGLFSFASKAANTVHKALDKSPEMDLEIRDIPFAGRFYSDVDDSQTAMSGINRRYFRVKEKIEREVANIKRDFEDVKEGKTGVPEFLDRVKGYDLAAGGFLDTDTLTMFSRHGKTVERNVEKGIRGYREGDLSGINILDGENYRVTEPETDRWGDPVPETLSEKRERQGIMYKMKLIDRLGAERRDLSGEEQILSERLERRLKTEVYNEWRTFQDWKKENTPPLTPSDRGNERATTRVAPTEEGN
jgi:hypothetical protein